MRTILRGTIQNMAILGVDWRDCWDCKIIGLGAPRGASSSMIPKRPRKQISESEESTKISTWKVLIVRLSFSIHIQPERSPSILPYIIPLNHSRSIDPLPLFPIFSTNPSNFVSTCLSYKLAHIFSKFY